MLKTNITPLLEFHLSKDIIYESEIIYLELTKTKCYSFCKKAPMMYHSISTLVNQLSSKHKSVESNYKKHTSTTTRTNNKTHNQIQSDHQEAQII